MWATVPATVAVSFFGGVCAPGAAGGQFVSLSELSFCFCGSLWVGQVVRGQVFFVLVSYVVFLLFDFVLWYFSFLRIPFNGKTGLTAVAFLFHLFL
jgi:hypothetical protein